MNDDSTAIRHTRDAKARARPHVLLEPAHTTGPGALSRTEPSASLRSSSPCRPHAPGLDLGIRDARDEHFEPWRSAPGRLDAARQIIAEVDRRDPADPVIVGGDFNAYSGLGPQEVPGAVTAEVTTLRDRFTDPLTVLTVPDADLCGWRIDYILVTGNVPTSYKQDCTANEPSDHPMVIALIEAN